MRFRRACFVVLGLLPLAITVTACSAGPNTNPAGQGGTGGGNTSDGGSGAGVTIGSGGNQGGQGGQLTVGSGTGGGTGGSCAAVSSEAKAQLQPADIVIAVDTSGSMDQESAQVQDNLNAFASIITGSGVDVHVVLIADNTVCIPQPLGSGQCGGADEKLPNYRHVVQTVGSNNALQLIHETYDQWKDTLRPGATKTLAVVTDDDSSMSAAEFTSLLLAKDPPTFQGFKFDAIASLIDPDSITFTCLSCALNGMFTCNACQEKCCDKMLGCTPLPADEGKVYKQLVAQTGGILGDLCIQDFGPVFQDMATGIVSSAKLSCDYDIPPPPEGEVLDAGMVNVNYTPSGQPVTPILNVASAADCGALGGWYYDNTNAPTRIIMCANTCAILQADTNGKVDVLFGCETQVQVPE